MAEYDMVSMYFYKATVTSIYDGDTFRADIDLGFNLKIANEPIRLLGIDTPEIRGEERSEGLKAKEYVESKIPVGSQVYLLTEKDKAGKYGRYLATVYYIVPFTPEGQALIESAGIGAGETEYGALIDLNAELVEQGLAKYVDWG